MSSPIREVLQRHHEASGASLTKLQAKLAEKGLDYSKSTVHNRLNGPGLTPDDLHALADIWGLSGFAKRELYEAAGFLVVVAA